MDQDLLAYLDQRFERIDQRLDGMEREIQQTRVVVHDQIKLLAEGMIGLEDKIQSFRADVALELAEVQKSIAPYYTYLDSRVHRLEDRVERENQAPLDVIRKLYSKTG
jgi:predicted  nucleic acid-binding Zn-ribbon protein